VLGLGARIQLFRTDAEHPHEPHLQIRRPVSLASWPGFDPARYAGHSLRAGLATAAAAANVPERVIALQTGHRSMKILRRYIRQGSLFAENAAAAVGL